MQKKRKPFIEGLAVAKYACELRAQGVQIEHCLVHVENEDFRFGLAGGLRLRSGGGRKSAVAFAAYFREKIQWAGHHGGSERGDGQCEISSADRCPHVFLPRFQRLIS